MQSTPFPSNPLLHVHTKLPITSAQVAFTWQLSVSCSHSSMSVCTGGFQQVIYEEQLTQQKHQCKWGKFPQKLLTCAVDSISFKSTVASTYKATNHISTGGIHMAIVCVPFTLINVCMWRWILSGYMHTRDSVQIVNPYNINARCGHSFPSKNMKEPLTCAVDSISFKSAVAFTLKATNHIHTGGIDMAVVCVLFTLINVCM